MKVNQKQKQIPKDWRELKLGDVGITYAGLTGKDKTDFGIGKPFVNYMDVYGSGAMRKLPTSLVRVGEGERQNVVQYGDVVFTTSSETADEVGTASVFLAKSNNPVYLNSFCFGFRINHDFLSPGYAQFFFRSKPFRREMTRIAQGATRYNLSKSHFLQTDIALPSLPEQKRIVKVLETWDRAVEVLRRKIELKKEIKKGLMQELLTGKTRLPGFSGEWEKVILSDVGTFSKGAGILRDQVSPSGYNAVRYGELYTVYDVVIDTVFSHVSKAVALTSKKIQYGDILFAGSGETIDEIGKSAVYLSKDIGYAGGDIVVFTPKNVNSIFLAYYLNTGFGRKRLRELGQGQSVVHIYKSDIEQLSFVLPKQKEQSAISKILLSADSEIIILEKKLSLLEDQKKYLLNNLITGAIRTPEKMNVN